MTSMPFIGCADFVAHGGEEVGFRRIRGFRRLFGHTQFARPVLDRDLQIGAVAGQAGRRAR